MRFAGGGRGGLEVVPRGGEVAGVDGLPPGEGGGVGQDQGELLAAAWGEGVTQAVLELSDVGGELGRECGSTDPAVKLADGLGLVLKKLGD